jgi:malate/lactate dehydrogenase
MPTVVGREGVETRVPIQLNEQEESALSASAEQLSKVAAQLDLAL